SIALHPAIVIVKRDPGYVADHEIEHPARPDLVPGIKPYALPTAHHVQPLAERLQELRDFVRIVLQVPVHSQDTITPGGAKTGRGRRRLAEVAPKANALNPGMLAGEIADQRPRAVCAAVVHVEQFQLQVCSPGHFRDLVLERGKVLLLVVYGD